MGIALGSSFDVQTALPLDSREQVADLTARDAIPSGIRYEGLTVYVLSEEKKYVLKGGVTNADWSLDGGGNSDPVAGILYIKGDDSTDGSWRFYVDTGVLKLQTRVTGSWVTLETNTP